jgi:hypothetical protein
MDGEPMSWGRLDDEANDCPKLIALSDGAFRLWACGIIYAQKKLTDGFIPARTVAAFPARRKGPQVIAELTSKLVPGRDVLWHVVDGGYQIHDYLDWNDRREDVLKARELGRERLNQFRQRKGDRNAVRNAFRNALQTPHETPHETRLKRRLKRGTTTTTTTTEEPERAPTAPTRALLTQFDSLHHAKFGTKAAIRAGKDAKLLAELWRQRQGDPVTVEALMTLFFAASDPFIQNAGYTVGVFVSQIGKLLPKAARAIQPPEIDWFDECKTLHGGECGQRHLHEHRLNMDAEKVRRPA